MSEAKRVREREPSGRDRGRSITPRIKITPPDHSPAGNGSTFRSGERMEEVADRKRTVVAEPRGWQDRFLRVCDIVVASLALIALSPLLLAIAVAIKLDSEGPVFYRQLRIGVDRRRGRVDDDGGRRTQDIGGRPFLMHKFRTMRVDAERESGPVWSSRDDDRVTRVGRFLRRHRLDELPQFWNVLKGDMSVVGPRPERPSLVSQLRREIDTYQARQRVRPGITGWAQVNQESDQSVDDVRSKLRYDLEYLQKRSVSFDFRIMARTIPVMLEREVLSSGDEDGTSEDGRSVTGKETRNLSRVAGS